MLNVYSLPPLFTALIALYLGFLVLFKNKKSSVNRTFFLVCLCTFWWQFSWFILFNIQKEILAFYVVKVGYSAIIFISIAFFHFVVEFLNVRIRKFLIVNYLIGLLFLIFLWTSNFFIIGLLKYSWGYYPCAGPLHPFHLLQLCVITTTMVFLLARYAKFTKPYPVRYNQTKYILMAIIFYFPASSDYLVNYGIEFYPLGFIFVLSSLAIFSFSIELFEAEKKAIYLEKLAGMSDIVGGFNHEIRNLLVSISMFVQMAVDLKEEDLKEAQVRPSIDIQRMTELLNAVQNYRTTSESKEIKLSNIKTELENALSLLKDELIQAKIELKCDIQNGLPQIETYSTFNFLFLNLFKNSLYAMERKGGSLEVGVKKTSDKDYPVEVIITDTGGDLSRFIKDNIVEAGGKELPQRAGIGGINYFLAKLIVYDHKGDLQVRNNQGIGTVFIVRLPLRQ